MSVSNRNKFTRRTALAGGAVNLFRLETLMRYAPIQLSDYAIVNASDSFLAAH